jgi:hypothetical protein
MMMNRSQHIPLFRSALLLSVPCLGLLLSSPGPGGEPEKPPSVDSLVRLLGSEDFQTREEASRQLRDRDDAVPALRAALDSPDPEVSHRADDLLQALEHRYAQRALRRGAALLEEGTVDEGVERLVRWRQADADGLGETAVLRLFGKLLELETKQFQRNRLPALNRYAPYRPGGEDFRRAEELPWKNLYGIILSSGHVHASKAEPRLLLACGPCEIEIVHCGVIVCDGDYTGRELDGCLLIANGDVNCAKGAGNTILAAGSVRIQGIPGALPNIIREHEKNALGFVRFFDPARVGLVTDPDAKDVRLKDVRRGTPFAAAGLRAGDIVLAIGGKDTPDREGFRRLLRRGMAEGEVRFSIRRDGKTLELTAWPRD